MVFPDFGFVVLFMLLVVACEFGGLEISRFVDL